MYKYIFIILILFNSNNVLGQLDTITLNLDSLIMSNTTLVIRYNIDTVKNKFPYKIPIKTITIDTTFTYALLGYCFKGNAPVKKLTNAIIIDSRTNHNEINWLLLVPSKTTENLFMSLNLNLFRPKCYSTIKGIHFNFQYSG